MCFALEVVVERFESRNLAEAMAERLGQHPVREPRVARKKRAVEIRADRTTDAAAFPAALAVVAESGDDPSERLGALVRRRTAVALGAGALTALASAVYALNFWADVPTWWALLSVVAAGAALLPLARPAHALVDVGRLRTTRR